MPPRFAYWTILIDNTPTAFRAQHQEDLLPTLAQLRRTNKDVVMKWFARGRLWESQDAARAAAQKPRFAEKRGSDWRPGGQHADPRAKFKKRPRFDDRKKDRRPPRPPDVVQAFRPANSRPPYSKPGHPKDRRPQPDRGPKSFNPRRRPEDPDTKPKT